MANSFLDNLKLPFNALAGMAVEAADNPGEFLAESFTPYGNYVSARDAREDWARGDYGWGTANALAALPGLGMVGVVGRGAKRSLSMTKAARLKRANALADMDHRLYRGGRPPGEDGLLGEQGWLSRNKQHAEGFANNPGNTLQEYVPLKSAKTFDGRPGVAMSAEDGVRLARLLTERGLDRTGTFMADAARAGELGAQEAAQIVYSQLGEPALRGVFEQLGYDALDLGRDFLITNRNTGVVRDLARARFDPAQLGNPSVTAGVALGVPGAAAYLGEEESY